MRFADDLIIYANSLDELVDMLEILIGELRLVGLDLNTKKSKIFTLDKSYFESVSPILVDVANGLIELARSGEVHKYLGSAFPGNLKSRGRTILAHRIKCAWAKFHFFHSSLTNRHVD